MDRRFGEFVREKRMEHGLKLKHFAELVGISPVYESYIESGKRPAPTERILESIIRVLELSAEDADLLYSMAELSRRKTNFPEDIWGYIVSRPYVVDALRIAAKNDVSEKQWKEIKRIFKEK